MNELKNKLDDIAQHFSMSDGFNGYMTKYRVDTVLTHCPGQSLIDIGSADAFMAEALSGFYKRIVSLDGSLELINRAKNRLNGKINNIEFICSLIEDYKTNEKFDVVLLSFILEHLQDPIGVLKGVRHFVSENGCVFIMVPNCDSLHRKVGKSLGLISELDSLNDIDKKQGHHRVYSLKLLEEHVKTAGLSIIEKGTFFIKPFSNPQMDLLDKRICDALYDVSQQLPGLGSMIYIKAR